MGPTLSPETSAFKLQTPGKFPEEYKLHSEHGESLKTTKTISVHCPVDESFVVPISLFRPNVRSLRRTVPEHSLTAMSTVRVILLL